MIALLEDFNRVREICTNIEDFQDTFIDEVEMANIPEHEKYEVERFIYAKKDYYANHSEYDAFLEELRDFILDDCAVPD